MAEKDVKSLHWNPHPMPFFLPYTVPVMIVVTHYSSNPWHSLFPMIFVWVIIPLLDKLVPVHQNKADGPLTASQRRELNSQLFFRIAVLLWAPTQFMMLLWALMRVSSCPDMDVVRLISLVSSLGLIAAEGIICAHELLHRRSSIERFIGDLLLAAVWYGHFAVEHARGHHFRVATPDDPATLRYGESFYHFFPRTLVGSLRSAWRLEASRMRAAGRHVFSPHNKIVRAGVLQLVLPSTLAYVLGSRAVMFFVAQAFLAILLLEQVNAIEHYGLLRRQRADGSYEPVSPRHSWDAPHSISSYLLFKLQLHADHHLRTLYLTSLLFSCHEFIALLSPR